MGSPVDNPMFFLLIAFRISFSCRGALILKRYSSLEGSARRIGITPGIGSLPAQEIPSPISNGDIGSVRKRSLPLNLRVNKLSPNRILNLAVFSSVIPRLHIQLFAHPNSDPLPMYSALI